MSVKFSVRNSGAGNGCANFVHAWKNAFFLQDKPMSIKFLLLGGGAYFGFGGGGERRFCFYGRADFSEFLVCDYDPQWYIRPAARSREFIEAPIL